MQLMIDPRREQQIASGLATSTSQITINCGVAELGAEEQPPAAIKRADQAMYLAKRAGKNRVVAA